MDKKSIQLLNTLNIVNFKKITIGRVNETYVGELNTEKIIIKINWSNDKILQSELKSLKLLMENNFNVPRIKNEGKNYIILEYIENIGKRIGTERSFLNLPFEGQGGRIETKCSFLNLPFEGQCENKEILFDQLNKLHTIKNNQFGFDSDTFSGILQVSNSWCAEWDIFFKKNRWIPLFNEILLSDENLLSEENSRLDWILAMKVSDIISKIFENIVIEPSLLHGDMNINNYLIDGNKKLYFIDPSCFFGHDLYDECCYTCWTKNQNTDNASILYYSYIYANSYFLTKKNFLLKKSRNYMLKLLSLYPVMYSSLLINYETIKPACNPRSFWDCILIQGGSYNPVHINHVRNIELCMNHLSQYQNILVVFQLASCARIKQKCTDGIEFKHRLNMLKIATQNIKNCVIDISFYWGNELINHYQNLFGAPIYICCGADTIEYHMKKFKETNIMVVDRTNYSKKIIDTENINGNKIFFVDNNKETKMSSRYIRKNKEIDKISKLMHPDVLTYYMQLEK